MKKIVIGATASAAAVVGLLAYPTSRGADLSASAAQDEQAGRFAVAEGEGVSARNLERAYEDGVHLGDSVPTQYGPIQVEIEVRSGTLTDARAVVYPEPNRRSERINKLAVPMLDQSATQSQGAKVDAVSGATFTAVAYEKSLQSALDAAAIEEAQTAK